MTAVLTTEPRSSASRTGSRIAPRPGPRTRHVFPVGARFPRRTVATELAYLAEIADGRGFSVASSPIFPVGARFPRRTPAEVQAHLADRPARHPGGAVTALSAFPVGARFPRHRSR